MTGGAPERLYPGGGAEQRPSDADAPPDYLEAVRAFCKEDYQEAGRLLRRALLEAPTHPLLLAALGHVFLHQGEMERAETLYQQAVENGSTAPELLANMARVALHRGERERAIAFLAEAALARPTVRPGRFYLGLQFPSADAFLAECHLRMGLLHRELDHLDDARAALAEALRLVPQNVTAHQTLGEMDLLDKNFLSAIEHYEAVISATEHLDDQIDAHNNLGVAHYENGDLEEAVRHLTWVLENDAANPVAVNNLNHIYEREGIYRSPERRPRGFRFMDVREGASPIFELTGGEPSAPGMEPRVVLVGRSQEMMRAVRHARLAAANDSAVLLQGERGTGKELLARAIHHNSSRSAKPFLVVNCTAMPEQMLESELFGHEKGAFAGARQRKLGRLELADGGTLFLDDVSALTPYLQVRLLRFLQSREVTPMGSITARPVDVRLIAATTRPLQELVGEGSFREDVAYALSTVPVVLPPLRERTDDIAPLVEHFLRLYGRGRKLSLSREDREALLAYPWPGNVRELEAMIERAVIMGSQSNLYMEEIAKLKRHQRRDAEAARVADGASGGETSSYPVHLPLSELERRHILRVLSSSEGNHRKAAAILGINPSTLWRKLKSYERDGGPATPD